MTKSEKVTVAICTVLVIVFAVLGVRSFHSYKLKQAQAAQAAAVQRDKANEAQANYVLALKREITRLAAECSTGKVKTPALKCDSTLQQLITIDRVNY